MSTKESMNQYKNDHVDVLAFSKAPEISYCLNLNQISRKMVCCGWGEKKKIRMRFGDLAVKMPGSWLGKYGTCELKCPRWRICHRAGIGEFQVI